MDVSLGGLARRIEWLEELLKERDAFIVRKGLWTEFVDQLRSVPIVGQHTGEGK